MNGWCIRGGTLSLERPLVMGILNVTPDSFSDGGRYDTPETAAARARVMAAEGADILDIGAQSTRPGAEYLSAEEEWARLAPCLRAVQAAVDIPLSVDTFHPQVAARALEAGVHIINDVSGSEQNGMASVAARYGAGMVFMRTGDPSQRTATAEETVAAAKTYFRRVTSLALSAGLSLSSACVDVGIGFGSSVEGDLALIARLDEIAAESLAAAVLVGASRKRVVREICGDDLLAGSVALHTAAMLNGAHIVRAHDVAATVAAARAVNALQKREDI
ncbi:MAG: dihydropteroate synthase [Ruminococcaceae bacterium]|nr:dihydropteroate synthase [Oscillospiraceae bacterium]